MPGKKRKAEDSAAEPAPAGEDQQQNEGTPHKLARNAHLQKFTKQLFDAGHLMLHKAGMRTTKTEALGDCWLISILAGKELPMHLVHTLTDDDRKLRLTVWRKDIVEYATGMTEQAGEASARQSQPRRA